MPVPADRVKEIFYDAASLDVAIRADFLDRACSDDADLRGRVEALLKAHDEAGEFLGDPTASPQAEPFDVVPDVGPGDKLGSFTLLSVIGEGGFGTVFLAEQTEPITRRVAVKVLKPGMDTRYVIARFEAERQTLAMMDHPGIAKVVDAGATPTGRPYVVIEYVDGAHITRHADQTAMTVRERLELFEKVCIAVQHAHQKGVIHRDLKPSNILVADVDGEPTPKVIDFGIAKALAGLPADASHMTLGPQLLGTPDYMSPEQAAGKSDELDTRSDVYSLGVLLYELLCGSPPFNRDRLRSAGPSELERVLRDERPPRPTQRFSALETDEQDRIARQRSADPMRLVKQLKGDPVWIVMRAMEKDPERRYPTAYALAADVRKHLENRPVDAGPPSALYLTTKLLKRHRVAGVAGLAASIAITVAVIVIIIAFFRVRDAANQATMLLDVQRGLLWESYLAQARASRRGDQPGRRFSSLDALTAAAAIRPSIDLRSEALAAMTLADVRIERDWSNVSTAGAFGLDVLDRMAIANEDGLIEIRSTRTDELLNELRHDGLRPWVYKFSPDGRYFGAALTGAVANIMSVWDLTTSEQVLVHLGGRFQSDAIAFTEGPDGATLVAYGIQDVQGPVVRIHNLTTNEPFAAFPFDSSSVALAFDHDGDRLAVASVEAEHVNIIDVATGDLLQHIELEDGVWSIDFSFDDRYLAGACRDYNVYVWHALDGELHTVLKGHQGEPTSLEFATDSTLLATSGWDATVRLWDVEREAPLLGPIENWRLLGFGGEFVAVRDGRVALWTCETGGEVSAVNAILDGGTRSRVDVDPQGRYFAASGVQGIEIWDTQSGRRRAMVTEESSLGVLFVHDGQTLLTLEADGVYQRPIDRENGFSLGPPQKLWTGSGDMRMATIPGSPHIVVAAREGVVIVDPHDGSEVAHLDWYNGLATVPSVSMAYGYAFSGNWKGRGGLVRDITTGEVVLEINASHVVGEFSPDGRRLIIGTGREFVCYDVADWSVLWTKDRTNSDDLAGTIAYSDDGRLLALSQSRFDLEFVHPETGARIVVIECPNNEAIGDFAFSDESRYFILRSRSTTAQLFDLQAVRARLDEMNLDWAD